MDLRRLAWAAVAAMSLAGVRVFGSGVLHAAAGARHACDRVGTRDRAFG